MHKSQMYHLTNGYLHVIYTSLIIQNISKSQKVPPHPSPVKFLPQGQTLFSFFCFFHLIFASSRISISGITQNVLWSLDFAQHIFEIYPMLLNVSLVHSLYEYNTMCLSNLLSIHVWDVPILRYYKFSHYEHSHTSE